MSTPASYQIKLPQFEGPFDLLLFFIERDELDIYNIPITRITNDFLGYIQQQESLNIEMSSEFILFISTLMRIKAKMLIPRKEVDADGKEIDPRDELVSKLLEYKKFKEASAQMAEMEALRMLMVKRGNIQKELSGIGEEASEGTEIQNITLFKLMKAFEKAMQKYSDRVNKPVHTVVQYRYTMDDSRQDMLTLVEQDKTVSFEKIFQRAENRVHAIFLFLSLLELVQQKYMKIMIGEGTNNFILEYNSPEDRLVELEEEKRMQEEAGAWKEENEDVNQSGDDTAGTEPTGEAGNKEEDTDV
ncbi:segregation and condensation protein A [Terrimonas rubra]|uniref:Segregation and condensation protein A n=1 Tax=Terrimonas rubra TaxID=1035890 RepID=A0ABW6A4C5_9BACT